jgi:HD-GYP domain-containing protein (c-di-GMP phosphodiesterase class II)
LRAITHYLTSLVILTLYGVRVCPFLESLSPAELGIPVTVAIFLQWLLRRPATRHFVEKAPYENRVRRSLLMDGGLYLFGGIALAAFNTVVYDFPPGSGLKVVIGFASLGFFAAVDLALEQERLLARQFQKTGQSLEATERYFPISRKLGLFAAVTAIMVTLVLFLVVNKDLHWLLSVSEAVSLHEAQRSILKEFVFVTAIILAHVLNIIHSYARNLRFFFATENGVLERTNRGDLNGRVSVSTNDEFGIMARHTNLMVDAIRERTEEIQRTRDVTILSLASLAETRDNETGAHLLRTQRYVRALAEQLADHERFRDSLHGDAIELLFKSAPLHDIGKVGIPDVILLKPGKLTDAEFSIMKTHTSLGSEAIQVAEKALGGTSFLHYAREITETHHEKWDGSGYPKGLECDEIPVSGRLMALADVYDALISKRIYKPAFPHQKAKAIILEGRGTHFDPAVVDAFIAIENSFQEIAASFKDESYNNKQGTS